MPEQFLFVAHSGNTDGSERAKTARTIRSHVTRLMHAKSSARHAMQTMQPWSVRPYVPLSHSTGGCKSDSWQDADTATGNDRDSGFSEWSLYANVPVQGQQNDASILFPVDSGHQQDCLWTCPTEHDIHLAPILAHYLNHLVVDIPDMAKSEQRNLLRRLWVPLAMSEPAAMYATRLLAAAHYNACCPLYLSQADILQLKSCALAHINELLDRSSSVPTDALIGAVLHMAAYEAIFGDPTHYAAHMIGLRQMISSRGGRGALGLEGLLEHMFVWMDLYGTYMAGSRRRSGIGQLPTNVSFDCPDLCHFDDRAYTSFQEHPYTADRMLGE